MKLYKNKLYCNLCDISYESGNRENEQFIGQFQDSKKGEKRDQDNMIDRLSFRAICSIRFELENSNFEFLFLLNPRYDANSDRICDFLKSNFHQKGPIFIKSNYF